MKHIGTYIRKLVILLVGLPVVIVGIILVPLPGPGFLVIFAGLYILSYEFEWAQRYREKVETKLKDMLEQARQKTKKED